jgi:hypothetical protein
MKMLITCKMGIVFFNVISDTHNSTGDMQHEWPFVFKMWLFGHGFG